MAEEIVEIEENELEDAEVEFFEFIQLNKNVARLKLSEDIFDEKSIPPYSSLLSVSNLYGYFVAGTSKGFIYAFTKELRESFYSPKAEPFEQGVHVNIPEGRVHFLRLTSDQLTIIVGVKDGQVLFYDATKFSTKSSEIRPYQKMKFSDDIMDIRPNPDPEREDIIAFLLVSGVVYIKNFISNKEISSIQSSKIGEQMTAICWSPKGKQLVCGSQSGKLVQFTHEGVAKTTYQAPPTIQKPAYFVKNILWLENTIFIVTYYPIVQDENSEHVVFVISRESKSLKAVYSKVPVIFFPSPREKSSYIFMESIKDWGSDLKTGIICACTNSIDTNLIARKESNEWASLNLPETARVVIPMSNHHDDETLPIGMALDLSSTEPWVTKLTGDEDSQIPPVPILFIYNDESEIMAFRCFQKNAGISYPEMTVPIPIPPTGPSMLKNITGPSILKNTTGPSTLNNTTGPSTLNKTIGPSTLNNTTGPSTLNNTTGPSTLNKTTGPSMLKNIETTTIGAQTILASVNNKISAPVSTYITPNIPKNNVPSLGRPNNLKNNAAVGPNVQNAPLRSQIKQASPTGPDINKERFPHMIRLDATRKSVQEVQLLIDEIEKKYLIKYHERTKADNLENPYEWSIGDLPVIISETKRLEKEIKNIIESLSVLKQEATGLNLNFVKEDAMTKQEIGLLISPQKVPHARCGPIQSRITEKYEKAFKGVKENADELEKQLDMLHEQIKDHKANKLTGQPPLEYIDRSIRNISKGLYSNVSRIEKLNTQLDLISDQLASISLNENADDFVSRQIEHETRKSTIPVKCSGEAEENTKQTMKKEWKLFKLLNVNKDKRKTPYGTNLFSDIEPVQSYISPKVISPRKSKSPIKTRGSIQIGIDKNKHSNPLRNSFDEESDYNELYTPTKRNTYTGFGLPISEDTDEVSPKYSKQVSEIRERRLRYFEKEKDDVTENVYLDNTDSIYEPTTLRETRVRFQESSETRVYDDDSDEITEDYIQQKFENVDSDLISRIRLINNNDRLSISQNDPFENNYYESSKFSDIDNNYSDYFVSSPESPPKTEEGVSYNLSNEQKDTVTSEQSSTTQDSSEDSLEFAKLTAAEISSLSKVSEPHQYYDGEESKSDDLISIERPVEFEKKEEIIEPIKEEKVESNSFEEASQVTAEPSEITVESKVEEVLQQPFTTERAVTNESNDLTNVDTSFKSFGLKETSSFGATTSTSLTFGRGGIPNALNVGSSNIPPAFSTPPSTFNQTQSQQVFGQPSFGPPSLSNAFQQPTFGSTGFPIFGQPSFGQPGFGQPAFGPSSPLNPIINASNGAGFARFAESGNKTGFGSSGGFGNSLITPTSTNKPLSTPSSSSSDPTWSTWSEPRK